MKNSSLKPVSSQKKDFASIKENLSYALSSHKAYQSEEIEKGSQSVQNAFTRYRLFLLGGIVSTAGKNFDSIMNRIDELAQAKGVSVKEIKEKFAKIKTLLWKVDKTEVFEDVAKLMGALDDDITTFYEKLKPLDKNLKKEQQDNKELLENQKQAITKMHKKINSRLFFDKEGIESIIERSSSNFNFLSKPGLKSNLNRAFEKRMDKEFNNKEHVLESLKDNLYMYKLLSLVELIDDLIEHKDEAISETDKALVQNLSDLVNSEDYKSTVNALQIFFNNISLLDFDRNMIDFFTESSVAACEVRGLKFSDDKISIEENKSIKDGDLKKSLKEAFSGKLANIMQLTDQFNHRFVEVFCTINHFDLTQFIDPDLLKNLQEKNDEAYQKILKFKGVNTAENEKHSNIYEPSVRGDFEKLITDPKKKQLYDKKISEYDRDAQNFHSVFIDNVKLIEDQATKIMNNEFFVLGTRARSGHNSKLNPPDIQPLTINEDNEKTVINEVTKTPTDKPVVQAEERPKVELEKNVEMHFKDKDKVSNKAESPSSKKLPGKLKIDGKLASMGDKIISGLNTPKGKTPKNK